MRPDYFERRAFHSADRPQRVRRTADCKAVSRGLEASRHTAGCPSNGQEADVRGDHRSRGARKRRHRSRLRPLTETGRPTGARSRRCGEAWRRDLGAAAEIPNSAPWARRTSAVPFHLSTDKSRLENGHGGCAPSEAKKYSWGARRRLAKQLLRTEIFSSVPACNHSFHYAVGRPPWLFWKVTGTCPGSCGRDFGVRWRR